jgi:chromatin structure-remodeling complex subunit RSC1/2
VAPQARYEAKPDPEVYYLPDHANASIPEDIRSQFQCDAYGRVLFFTAPPVEVEKKGSKLHHTARYLVAKAEREERIREKRKRDAEVAAVGVHEAKRARSKEARDFARDLENAKREALERLNQELTEGTVNTYQDLYGAGWRAALNADLKVVEGEQDAVAAAEAKASEAEQRRSGNLRKHLEIRGLGARLQFEVRT